MIVVKKIGDSGTTGLECGPDVRCADCDTGMNGMIWIAERLIAMHHDEPVVELLCLRCARTAKLLIKEETEGKSDT